MKGRARLPGFYVFGTHGRVFSDPEWFKWVSSQKRNWLLKRFVKTNMYAGLGARPDAELVFLKCVFYICASTFFFFFLHFYKMVLSPWRRFLADPVSLPTKRPSDGDALAG